LARINIFAISVVLFFVITFVVTANRDIHKLGHGMATYTKTALFPAQIDLSRHEHITSLDRLGPGGDPFAVAIPILIPGSSPSKHVAGRVCLNETQQKKLKNPKQ